MDLKPMFRQILITLISFDIFCIVFNLLLFSMPHLSDSFMRFVFPYIVPYVLPLAQIALTGQVITVCENAQLFPLWKPNWDFFIRYLTKNIFYRFLYIILNKLGPRIISIILWIFFKNCNTRTVLNWKLQIINHILKKSRRYNNEYFKLKK